MYDVAGLLTREKQHPWSSLIILGLLVYMAIARLLRYQRALSMPEKHGLHHRAPYAKMTTDQAQAILKDLTELEFPKIFGVSIIFALFKVGIHLQ